MQTRTYTLAGMHTCTYTLAGTCTYAGAHLVHGDRTQATQAPGSRACRQVCADVAQLQAASDAQYQPPATNQYKDSTHLCNSWLGCAAPATCLKLFLGPLFFKQL